MFDIKLIRDDPAAFDAGLRSRGAEPRSADLLKLDEARRGFVTRLQEAQEKRNALSKDIGKAKAAKDEATANRLMAEVADLRSLVQEGEAEEKRLTAALEAALAELPNQPFPEVPHGSDESGNVELRRFGNPARRNDAKEHFEIGEALGLMDFEAAAKLSGSRFVVLKGALARLERALGQLMLDMHTMEHGYTEVNPPVLVRSDAVYGVGMLPKFAEDMFRTTNDFWLTPTAEVTLTNLVREQIVDEASLPRRYTALTPCFRSEAGSAGRDTRGMLRQHQFLKVEMVSITTDEASRDEHERMLGCAEAVLKRLELPFRIVTLCTGDMGFASRKTYDLEVWLPGQNSYREISSCSNCGDFQARRMDARYRPREGKGTRFVHTLNGSGVALGRALIAVMENYQNEDGSVAIPSALKPYMGGIERIEKA